MQRTMREQKGEIDTLKIKLDKANSNPEVFDNLHYKQLQREFQEHKDKALSDFKSINETLDNERIDKVTLFKTQKLYEESQTKISDLEHDIQTLKDKLEEKELSKKQQNTQIQLLEQQMDEKYTQFDELNK